MTRVASFDDGQVVLIPSEHQQAVSTGKVVEAHGNEMTVSHHLSLAQGDSLIVVTPVDDMLAEVLWTKPAEGGSWSGVRVLQRSHMAVPSRARR
jgi:hypothetical protein